MTTPSQRAIIAITVSMTGLLFSACSREVTVMPGDQASAGRLGTVSRPISPGVAGSAGDGGGAGVGAGDPVNPGGSGAAGNSGAAGFIAAAGSGDPGLVPGGNLMDGIDQVGAPMDSIVDQVEVLAESLSAIELPAVGSDGVSLVQYSGPEQAFVLHVDWSGAARSWYASQRIYYAYTTATAERHLAVLHEMALYGVHQNGESAELSGAPTAFKEFLAANSQGVAWVHYAPQPGGQAPVFGTTSIGEVVFQTWGGARTALTDALRYRARIDLSETHVAFVEYASTAPGTVGQIVVQPIAGGAAIVAAPSAHHQDRPAIDGDWVVWEEYLDATDAVIRARNLSSGEVRDLSGTTGFRTNPDIRGTRVVWEDQRSGRGDIYFIDLEREEPERAVVSGAGHSAAARLTSDGLVWIETAGDNIGLLRARLVL